MDKDINKNTGNSANRSNNRICFKEFFKLIICVSNKIFNPILHMNNSSLNHLNNTQSAKSIKSFNPNSALNSTKKTYDSNICIEKMLEIETKDIHKYLDNFIELNLSPIYPHIKSYLEKEIQDTEVFKRIFSESENIEIFLEEIKPILYRIYILYSLDKINLTYEEFVR